MHQDKTVEVLKEAILLEKRGEAFYRKIAQNSDNDAVKCFFNMMADEENRHISLLSDQYKAYSTTNGFKAQELEENHSGVSEMVLDEDQKKQIASSAFEAAAITAAVSMEKRAVDLYSERAKSAEDPPEKRLYEWLSKWEREHLNFLIEMDKELTEKIWHDQQFWPF